MPWPPRRPRRLLHHVPCMHQSSHPAMLLHNTTTSNPQSGRLSQTLPPSSLLLPSRCPFRFQRRPVAATMSGAILVRNRVLPCQALTQNPVAVRRVPKTVHIVRLYTWDIFCQAASWTNLNVGVPRAVSLTSAQTLAWRTDTACRAKTYKTRQSGKGRANDIWMLSSVCCPSCWDVHR